MYALYSPRQRLGYKKVLINFIIENLLDKDQQTMTYGPNLAHHLFLYDVSNSFTFVNIFKKYFDTENVHKIQTSVFTIKIL